MTTFDAVRTVLRDCLQLGKRGDRLSPGTVLFGEIPELDSMAVLTILVALEEHFGIVLEDEDVTAANFATVQTLCDLVDRKARTLDAPSAADVG
jgi:acyl carrier protein